VSHGTNRMADTLAAIHARALANPAVDPFMNRARADYLQQTLAAQGGFEPQGQYLLAQERLAAGQTREAISALEGIVATMKLSTDHIDPTSKVIYDFLAMSWLRLGEQQNCLTNPAANVCILPLEGQARHTDQEGARNAIRIYTAILRDFPDDLGSRWLLNLSYLAIGGYPDSVPKRHLITGIQPRGDVKFPIHHNIAPVVGLAVDGNAGGLAVEDFNGDGHLDLFMTSWFLDQPVMLFLADGDGGYTAAPNHAGLKGITGGLNVAHADYDNDGDSDVFLMRGAWLGEGGQHPSSLLRNRGDGTFDDVTFDAGLFFLHPTPTAAWSDFDRDGDLDLFVGHESGVATGGASHPSALYRNEGNGRFLELSREVGMSLDAFVKAASWGDVNDDGLPDLYVSVLFAENKLYVNRGAGENGMWRFEERAVSAGVTRPIASFGTWFWDMDQDGRDDIVALSYDVRQSGELHSAVAREYVSPGKGTGSAPGVEATRIYRNRGDGTFDDVSRAAGLEDKVIFAMGANFGDLDNDGWLDLHLGTGNPDLRSVIPNRMFRGVDGTRFQEVTIEGGFGHIQKGHATAFVDLDRDGDSDTYMVMGGAYQGDRAPNVLFENPGTPAHGWLSLTLEGTTANRSAIGARIRVDVVGADGAPRAIHRTVNTGGSFGSGTLTQLIGLGTASRISRVTITWPDSARTITTHGGLDLRRSYRIVQGEAAVALERAPVPFAKQGIAAHEKH
jgi:hypothetical protein